jgi:Flp pilus assembly protein TadG
MEMSLRRYQRGAAMIEFALGLMVFLLAVMAVIELARFMLVFNMAAEATRLAARLASTCDMGPTQQAQIRNQVRVFVQSSGQIQVGARSDWLTLTYWPSLCTQTTCQQVQASLTNLEAVLPLPLVSLTLPLPPFRSTALREAMSTVVAGETNPRCE